MIRSMTAFARHEERSQWGVLSWEIRSVNHRYLEAFIRLPENLRVLEPPIRERLNQRLGRGKLECLLRIATHGDDLSELSLNRDLATQIVRLGDELTKMLPSGVSLRPIDVLRWPGVVGESELDIEQLTPAVIGSLDHALDDLVATREREGARIDELIRQRSTTMGEHVAAVRRRRPEVLAKIREKLLARLEELPTESDPTRLEQELVIIAQRMDVDEELDRLDAHLGELKRVLQRSEPIGRRLDFLMQELNREANTLSAKSNDAETTRTAVDLKVLIEQMREQIQNIE